MALFLGWHATVSLCGPGHHALDGLVEHVLRGEGSPIGTEEGHASPSHHEADCAACHLFSQAVDSPPMRSGVVRTPAMGEVRLPDRGLARRIDPPAMSPRAPPRPVAV